MEYKDTVLDKYTITVLEFDKPTRAGYIYSKDCIEAAISDPIVKEQLDMHMLFSTDNFNEETDMLKVNGAIEELYIEDNKLVAKVAVLNTPCGRIAKAAADAGMSLDLALRGRGNIKADGAVSDVTLTGFCLRGK